MTRREQTNASPQMIKGDVCDGSGHWVRTQNLTHAAAAGVSVQHQHFNITSLDQLSGHTLVSAPPAS